MKKITILYICHKIEKERIDYFKKLSKLLHDFDFIFLYDGALKDKNFSFSDNVQILINNENIGKLKSIIKASEYINTPFFKVFDYDDCLFPYELIKLNSKLRFNSGNKFYYHTASKIFSDFKDYGLQTIDNLKLREISKKSKDVNFLNIPNAQLICNTNLIQKLIPIVDKLYRQNYFNDTFISLFTEAYTFKIKKIKNKPYIQYHQHGQTRDLENIKRNSESVNEIFKNLQITKNEIAGWVGYTRFSQEELKLCMHRNLNRIGVASNDPLFSKVDKNIRKLYE